MSVANWSTKSLQIHDLLTKKTLLPEGNTMLQFVSTGHVVGTMRCDVEFVADRILVLFTKDTTMQSTGLGRQRTAYSPVTGVPGIPVGVGEMMLFNSAGNPCWSEPTKIEKMTMLWEVPDKLPVMLFAVAMQTGGSMVENLHVTRILAVDKRSGKFRFRIESDPPIRQAFLRNFRVSADPLMQEITFAVPNSFPPEILKAVFTDKEAVEDEDEDAKTL